MDKETKIFFEKLAGINESDEESIIDLNSRKEDDEKLETNDEQKGSESEGEQVEDDLGESSIIEDEGEGELAVDVYQTSTNFIVESTVAGVAAEDLDISITPESVSIKGKREKTERVKTEDYFCQECYWGKFSRTIILPQEINPDKAQATIKNGILKITLPKISKSKSKKIKVKLT